MAIPLYRKSARQAIATVLVVFLLFTLGAAQTRTSSTAAKKAKRGPRALAVIEFLPSGGMRLVPITIWIDGRYYDASLYAASPQPMALEPETVYEAQSLGEPTGVFTITTPRQLNGIWIADGSWRPHLAIDDQLAAKAAKEAANKPALTDKTVFSDPVDGNRPVLKRAPGSTGDNPSTTTSSSPPPSSTSTTSSNPDRPTMKRPPAESSSKPTLGQPDDASTTTGSTSKSPTPTHDTDPDRPTLKRPATSSDPTSNSSTTSASAATNDSDPNRPVLTRSKPAKKPTSGPASPANDAPLTANTKGAKSYAAISDAGNYRGRPLLYSMSPGERKAQEDKALKLALDEIRAFAAKHNGPALPKTAAITDYDVRAFDLDYSSSPTIVLTAQLPIPVTKTQPVANFSYYITIVAKVDINDQLQKTFISVTDSRHLDAYPRMELIDAIDADANGRADLLFRRYSDIGITYGLYRVGPYSLDKIFEGGSGL